MIPVRLPSRVTKFLKLLSAPSTSRDRVLLFFLFILCTVCRLPRVVFQGRFWAEEARVFYWNAAHFPWLSALFYSYGGYMNFGANLAAVVARHLVPLDDAPRVTLVFAMAVQICPALLLLTSRDAWLRPRLALAACLWLLVAAPSAEEVWLNTPNSQFFLALSAALILALAVESGGREIFRRILLFFAPLYGLLAITLLPLFVLRAAIERSRGRWIQTLTLAAGAAIQMLWFYHQQPGRQTLDVKLILAMVFAKNLLLPLLGFGASQPTASWLHAALNRGILPVAVVIAILAAGALIFALAAKGPKEAWWLVIACGVVTLLSYYGKLLPTPNQVDPHNSERYAFAPQVLLAWSMVAIAAGGRGIRAKIAFGLVAWLSLVSADAYLHPAAAVVRGPKWRYEMVKWHADPHYSPKAWPDGAWVLAMNDTDFKLPPPIFEHVSCEFLPSFGGLAHSNQAKIFQCGLFP